MKVRIDYDEWYPVYYFVDWDPSAKSEVESEIEVDEGLVDYMKGVFDEFDEVQQKLHKLHEDARRAKLLKDSIEKGI